MPLVDLVLQRVRELEQMTPPSPELLVLQRIALAVERAANALELLAATVTTYEEPRLRTEARPGR